MTESSGALGHLERGEAVDVHFRHCVANCVGDVDVVVAVEVGMDTALQGHLGGAELPSLTRALGNVVEREEVGLAA